MKLRLTLALSLLGLAACSVYDPALMTQGLAGVPERPPASTSKSTDDVEAIFAFRNISLDQSGDRWRRFGLDLDGMNTSSIEDEAECVAANRSSGSSRSSSRNQSVATAELRISTGWSV